MKTDVPTTGTYEAGGRGFINCHEVPRGVYVQYLAACERAERLEAELAVAGKDGTPNER